MRRILFIIPALAGALGVAAPAFAQSDEVIGDEYPADDTAPPAEEYAGQDTGAYGDTGSYDDGSYDDTYANSDDSYATDDYANRTVSPETFQRSLAPYGRWVRTPEYGLIWIPSRSVVGDNFVPYTTGGNWRYSNAGWTFASNYSWGWAPFHYGRWYRAPRLGWVWMPGYTWGPAWVDWRYGDGYVGWAPLPPRRFAAALRYHDNWFFCSVRDMWRPHVWRYRVRSTPNLFRVAVLARRPVRYHGRARWFAGPSPRVVERVTGRRIDRVQLRPTRHERVVGRVDRRQQAPRQRVERQQIQRPERQRVERQQQRQQAERQQQRQQVERQQVERQQQRQQVERQQQRQQVERQQQRAARQQQRQVERQQAQRPQRQRAERQQVQRPERQQVREQRQQQRAERQQQRQQAREQRQQPSRERRRRPDRDR